MRQPMVRRLSNTADPWHAPDSARGRPTVARSIAPRVEAQRGPSRILRTAGALAVLGGTVLAVVAWSSVRGTAPAGGVRLPVLFEEEVDAPIVIASEPNSVALALVHGTCMQTPGPLASDEAEPLGLWSVTTQHVVCFQNREGRPDKIQFVASPVAKPLSVPGKFGFGDGVGVNLRPDIETQAVWPLEANIRSSGMALQADQVYRTLGLQTTLNGGVVSDIPIVVVRTRVDSWRFDVQLVNNSMGTCEPLQFTDVPRFVCRARLDAAGLQAELVAFCAGCAGAVLRVHEVVGHEEAGSRMRGASRERSETVGPAPWVGWEADVPSEGGARQWRVSVQPHDGAEAPLPLGEAGGQRFTSRRLQEVATDNAFFELVLLSGATPSPWASLFAGSAFVRAAGRCVGGLAYVAFAAAAVAALAACRNMACPVLAVHPALLAAVGALQFAVLLGDSPSAPPHLALFAEPLRCFSGPAEPWARLGRVLLLLAAVGAAHGAVVLRYLLKNGSGSAGVLPHGLMFGAWELRALAVAALPLAAVSCELTLSGLAGIFGPDDVGIVVPVASVIVGPAVFVAMAVLAVGMVRRLNRMFDDESVIAVELPNGGSTVYTDRVCDQLRAMPLAPGRSRLFGAWVDSPSWAFAPSVAAIQALEHRGGPETKKHHGSWRVVWAPTPWAPTVVQVKPAADAAYSRAPSVKLGLARSGSNVNSPGGGGAKAALARGASAQSLVEDLPPETAVLGAHKASVVTRFAYRSSAPFPVAGVAGAAWVDAAVPAASLRGLEVFLGKVHLRAHVGQLAGPLTSGRLAACFEWGQRWPYRCPSDLLVKLCLGVYLGSLQWTAAFGPTMHFLLALAALAAAAAVPCYSPYHSKADNLALASALASAGAAVVSVLMLTAGPTPGLTYELISILAALVALPLAWLLAASLMAISFAIRAHGFSLYDKVLPKVVSHWGRIWRPLNTPGRPYAAIWSEDEADTSGILGCRSCVRTVPLESAANSGHSADAVLLPPTEEGAAPDGRQLGISVPIELAVEVSQKQIRVGSSGARALQATSERPRLPLPTDLLLEPTTHDNAHQKTQLPLAALLTAGEGMLLYMPEAMNGNRHWRQAVRDFLARHDRSVALEAMRVIQEYEDKRSGDTGGACTLPIIEILEPER